ncbi:hypothetical protein FALBO_15769, partial [Fusarium albosuccineum]
MGAHRLLQTKWNAGSGRETWMGSTLAMSRLLERLRKLWNYWCPSFDAGGFTLRRLAVMKVVILCVRACTTEAKQAYETTTQEHSTSIMCTRR